MWNFCTKLFGVLVNCVRNASMTREKYVFLLSDVVRCGEQDVSLNYHTCCLVV
jgi:hypothetical protein